MTQTIDILGIRNLLPIFNNENNKDENIAFTTDLPNVDVTAYAADYQLGPDATYQQYYDWALEKRRKEAWQKAQLVRAGFAPLTSKAADSAIIEGNQLVENEITGLFQPCIGNKPVFYPCRRSYHRRLVMSIKIYAYPLYPYITHATELYKKCKFTP